MTKDQFLTASKTEQLQAIELAEIVWKRDDADYAFILYKFKNFYLQVHITKEKGCQRLDFFGP